MPRSSRSPSVPFRVGFGYDVHRLEPGRGMTLGGVKIRSSFRLVGHSDADVLLHAICDSLLGAAALGDIGKHFPNTDRRYRGISSLKLLAASRRAVERAGYQVVNVDSTIILERPKLGPATRRMEARIARTLGIAAGAVSVKATTHEGIGAFGRAEGCAAMSAALLART